MNFNESRLKVQDCSDKERGRTASHRSKLKKQMLRDYSSSKQEEELLRIYTESVEATRLKQHDEEERLRIEDKEAEAARLK